MWFYATSRDWGYTNMMIRTREVIGDAASISAVGISLLNDRVVHIPAGIYRLNASLQGLIL